MIKLFVILIALYLAGCATSVDKDQRGKPSLSIVIKDTNGCKDKIGIRGRGFRYHKCF